MSYNPNVAFSSPNQDVNISLRYIQTLQEAASIKDNTIICIRDSFPTPVELFLDINKEEVLVKYTKEKSFKDETIELKYFRDILSSFIIE